MGDVRVTAIAHQQDPFFLLSCLFPLYNHSRADCAKTKFIHSLSLSLFLSFSLSHTLHLAEGYSGGGPLAHWDAAQKQSKWVQHTHLLAAH